MERIASDGRREVHLHVMGPDGTHGIDPPFGGAPFAALVWAARAASAEERQRVCGALIAGDCAWLAFGGAGPGAWEEAADKMLAVAAVDAEADPPRVATTSHRGEAPADVAAFLLHAAASVRICLFLLLGDDPAVRRALEAAAREALGA